MQLILTQMLGILIFVVPLVAIQWNLAGNRKNRVPGFLDAKTHRWRLELYSNDADIAEHLADRADIPFPIKEVKSARGRLAERPGSNVWALPRIEFDVDVDDPLTDDALSGLFGPDHQVRFVTGNEAVVDARGNRRVRLRALEFKTETT